ncbi:TolB-like translocation protein, partial [Actinacidiphila rubida]
AAGNGSGSGSGSGSGNGSGGGTGNGGSGQGGSGVKPVGSASPVPNGTAHNGLTISNGTRFVVMNGTRVDFGTEVRDLAWSPDGRRAAFVDGDGDLAVSDPDGSGRVVVARNPGGQNWSHPTWQVRAADPQTSQPALDNLVFAVRSAAGVATLVSVPATAHGATPKVLGLNRESGANVAPLPQTGNSWPSSAGRYGTAVYANSGTGEVYLRDDYLRQQGSALTHGSEPALAPTQDEDVVFVRSVGGHDHLFLEHSANSGPTYRDLTPDAITDYTEPAWSPDGRTIAARTPAGIVTLPADGSHAPVRVSGYTGLPAYRA